MASIRLLHRKTTGEITFNDPIAIEDASAYAILSHTWAKEEVSYEEMENGADMSKTLNKAGWKKIQFCADQAEKDGLQNFWVDTCCIDRRHATELSAAINSMFRWYQDAARCYVYLADVSQPDPEAEDDSVWKEQFKKSRWFLRGWTLQELIAPLNVKFFSEEGIFLGNKSALEQEIMKATQLPIKALRRSRLSEFGLNERMGWTAKRKTTYPEDEVYCLFGIFEVFVHPIYGEGKAHAFLRLQEETAKRTGNQGGEVLRLQPGTSSLITEIEGIPIEPIQASSHGSYRSPTGLSPVLDIPSKEIEVVLARAWVEEHFKIAEIIAANCVVAGITKALADTGQSIIFHLRWQNLGSFFVSYLDGIREGLTKPRRYPTVDEDPFADPFDIIRILDHGHHLSPLTLERGLCCAIVWCRMCCSPSSETSLASLWAELHASTIDENWQGNLQRAQAEARERYREVKKKLGYGHTIHVPTIR